MPQTFVAVVAGSAAEARSSLIAAGASAVLSWGDLLTSDQPDDAAAVLVDVSWPAGTPGETGLAAVLSALRVIEKTSAETPAGSLVVTTRPVTDTLKLVDAAGTLCGTADRNDHRFIGAPIAVRLRLLRSVAAAGPDPVAVLTALASRGVGVVPVS